MPKAAGKGFLESE